MAGFFRVSSPRRSWASPLCVRVEGVCLQHGDPSLPGGLAGLALPGRHCLSCYWNLASWFIGARCGHMCSHTQQSHTPSHAGCRGRKSRLCARVRLGPSLLGAVLLGTSRSCSWGLCSRWSPSGASTEHVCSAAHGGSWAQAPAQPQVTEALLQRGTEERAAVPTIAALAWQV